MERLSSLDTVFLAIENRHTPMTIGSVAIFEGSAPPLDEIRDLLAPRIARIPRCRQRVRETKGPFGRPIWIDDVHFDLRNHLRAHSLHDRSRPDLDALVAELLVTPLDRAHPLWRVSVVSDVGTNRWALVTIAHHCLVDGIAGNDLMTAILAPEPDEPVPGTPWQPAPEPSGIAVFVFSLRRSVAGGMSLVRGALRALAHPRRSWHRARNTVRAARRLWYRQEHVPTSLVGPIGTGRRWLSLSVQLTDLRRIQEAFGCTVNDVVLAAVTAGFRDLLVARGDNLAGRTVTAMVPVSLRTSSERGTTGNRVANVHAHLPVGSHDPISTLQFVHAHLDELKDSHEVEATGLLMNIGNYVPRFVADRIARAVVARQRNVETTITNVPGPEHPLSLGSHRMIAGYPVAPIAGLVRITVAVWSYCGTLSIGITGDRDAVADIDILGHGIRHGFEDLLESTPH